MVEHQQVQEVKLLVLREVIGIFLARPLSLSILVTARVVTIPATAMNAAPFITA